MGSEVIDGVAEAAEVGHEDVLEAQAAVVGCGGDSDG
jgi:hypothetical protein